MTRLLTLTAVLNCLLALPLLAATEFSNNARADSVRGGLRGYQLQTPQRLPRSDLHLQKRQQSQTANPIAKINPPRRTVTKGQPAVFTSGSLADPDIPITAYRWIGPGGQTSSTQSFTVDTANLEPSTYTVTLVVSDRRRRQSQTRAVLVINKEVPPVAIIVPGRTLKVTRGKRVSFFSKSHHPDRRKKIIRTQWQTSWGQRASGNRIDIDTHNLNPGQYSVALEVSDNSNLRGSAKATLIIDEPQRPLARVTPRLREVTRGELAEFHDDGSRDRDGRIIAWNWSLDGRPLQGGRSVAIETSNLRPGQHGVTLEVTDDDKLRGTATATLFVREPPTPLVARISPPKLAVNQGQTAEFHSSVDPDVRIRSYSWSLAGRQAQKGSAAKFDTSNLSPGRRYGVTLEVTDNRGSRGTATATLFVNPPPTRHPPVARITPRQREVHPGDRAEFDGSRSTDADGEIIAWSWSLDGQQRQTGRTAKFDTSKLPPGQYSVTLEVTDNDRLRGSAKEPLIVQEQRVPPVARISPPELAVNQGDWAKFDGSGSRDRDGRIIAWNWSLNDEPVSGQSSVRIDTGELDPGEFRVGLEVTDEQELTASDEARLIVLKRVQEKDIDAALVEMETSATETAPNREIKLWAVVANRGKELLRNVLVRFMTRGGTVIYEEVVSTLAAGDSKRVGATWVPKTAGEQLVIAAVDPDNRLQETDEKNNRSTRTVVVEAPPVVSIDPSPLEISQGDRANFAGRIIFPGARKRSVAKYSWSGPGKRSGQGAQFSFNTSNLRPGRYKVNLEITDSSGLSASAGTELIVKPLKAEVWLSADNEHPKTGQSVNFSGGVRRQARGVEFRFTFGDGEQTDWKPLPEAVHRYEMPGQYVARLSARRTKEIIGTSSIEIAVVEVPYKVFLRPDGENIRAGEPLRLLAVVEPPIDDVEFQFRFGDREESGWTREPAVTHRYKAQGAYDAHVVARVAGVRLIQSPPLQVIVAKSGQIPWILIAGVGFVVLAAAATMAYRRRLRLSRTGGGISVVPQLNLETLHVETEGKLNSGCEFSLRGVQGQHRYNFHAPGTLLGVRGNGGNRGWNHSE